MDILKLLGIEPALFLTQAIGFLILMGLLWKFGFRPLMGVIDQRQADIRSTYDQLDADRVRMEETRREYEQRLAGIEAEAREHIQAAVKEAQQLRDNMVNDAKKQAETIVEQSRQESERERQKAFLEMRQQMVSLTVAAAGKVIGETLDAQRHTKMVDDFIGRVGMGAIIESGRGVSGNNIGQGGTAA